MTDLTTLDFDSIKSNLKNYLKEQSIFQDYDFEGSNISVLLDVLAYNSYLNGFYLNMLGSEMFLDSAQLRDSVISHTKELNYLPRSFRSATASVNLIITDSVASSVIIPRGTSFTGTAGNRNFTFVTGENVVARSGSAENTFIASDVNLYEGDYVSDSFVVNTADKAQRFTLSNKTIDVTSLLVAVMEDNGSNLKAYKRVDSLFGLGSASEVFFIQPTNNDRYEIVFGDGVIGRKPKNRAIVTIQYRACNGELPNGIAIFTADGKVGTSLITNVTVNAAAKGGAISESLDSIKYNAPRAFTTQERVVTARDYETLLVNRFTEINDISAYGGEEFVPPRFGKVIIAVDLKTTDQLPPSRRLEFAEFIKQRSPLAIDPIFVQPEYTYVKVTSKVRYNINQTQLTVKDIQFIAKNAIQEYSASVLDGFNKTLRYSRLLSTIDNSQSAIVSNDTEILAVKSIMPSGSLPQDFIVDFGVRLKDDIPALAQSHPEDEVSIISSSNFIFNDFECFIQDDGDGLLYISTSSGGQHNLLREIGVIDYVRGILTIEEFLPSELIGASIDISARTFDLDVRSERRTILKIRPEDITVNVEQVRL